MKKRGIIASLTGLLLGGLLMGCLPGARQNPNERLNRALAELEAADSTEKRFYALPNAAKTSFAAGNLDDARKYAIELQSLMSQFPGNWSYGNAVHDAHLVLGRIALKEGRVDEARQHLIEAGKSPGSPTMNSFGPNMSLAKDLLEKGEKEVVLEYFGLCRIFWKSERGRLNRWSQEVSEGKIPEFGANLVY